MKKTVVWMLAGMITLSSFTVPAYATQTETEIVTESSTESETVQEAVGVNEIAATGSDQDITPTTEQTVSTEKASETKPETQKVAVAPVKVTKVKASIRKANTITLTWKAQDTTIHYLVYKYDTKKETYKKIGTATKNYYTVKNLKSGTQYKFLIQAFNPESIKAKGVVIKASTIVTKVTGISTKSATTSSVTLKWKKTTDVSGYEIRVYDKNKKKYVKQATVKKTGTSYTAKKLTAGKAYKYQIRAYKTVNGKKVYSSASTYTTVTKPAKVVIKSLSSKWIPPVDKQINSNTYVTLKNGYDVIILKWNKVSGATGYQVYMYDTGVSKYVRANDTKSTNYKPDVFSKSYVYKYKVRAYKTVNGTKVYGEFSSVASIDTEDLTCQYVSDYSKDWNGYDYSYLGGITDAWANGWGGYTKKDALTDLKAMFPTVKSWTFKRYPANQKEKAQNVLWNIDETRYFRFFGVIEGADGGWYFIYGR